MINNKDSVLTKLQNDPNNYDLNLQLGLFFVNEKNYSEAKNIFKKLISLNQNRYEGFLNLSNIFEIYNKLDKSEKILKKYINKNKYNKEIISGLAILYYNSGNYKKLHIIINQYIEFEENHILFFLKGFLYENDNKVEKQILFLQKSINTNRNFWPAYEKLFNALERSNKINEFYKLVIQSNERFQNELKLSYYLALCLFRKNESESALKQIEVNKLESEFNKLSNLSYLINLFDLLSKIHLKLNNHKLSLHYAIKRNKSSIKTEANKKFDKNILLDIIKKYNFFYKSRKQIKLSKNSIGLFHDNVTFLVGFPRSGTTLLDSILRSHSKTLVLEEEPYLIKIRHKFFEKNTLEKVLTIKEDKIIDLQKEYFNSFNYSEKKLIIDKFPLNLIELGFIKKIFPRSKIILALRHPLDTILSCVLTSFKINEAMANYENLETSAFFYNEVFNLFKTYENSMKFSYYSIKYESVVQKFDEEVAGLLSYLKLEFEDSVKNYHITAKNRQKINTPSYHQVIKPIYTNSLSRYKKFPEIAKIKPLINKWINEFKY